MLTQLRDIGLSENEAKVYMAMMELGPATVLQIASKSGINRPTTYVQIEALKKRGLVDAVTRGKKTLLVPQDPARLDAMLEREAKEIEVHKSELVKIMPQLQTMWDLGGKKPRVVFFEGLDGLREMQLEFLKSKERILYGISSIDEILNVFPKPNEHLNHEMLKRGIRRKFIYTSLKGPIMPEDDPAGLRQARYIDPRELPFTADVSIFDDSVVVASLRVPYFGAIITQPEVAASFKSLFNLIWKLISAK